VGAARSSERTDYFFHRLGLAQREASFTGGNALGNDGLPGRGGVAAGEVLAAWESYRWRRQRPRRQFEKKKIVSKNNQQKAAKRLVLVLFRRFSIAHNLGLY
jgi:hypothetical protein